MFDAPAFADGLAIKDEGRCHPVFGGNKVRKLERILAAVARRPVAERRIVTLGAVGSHHVLATAIHGASIDAKVEALLIPRPWSAHAEEVLHSTIGRARLAYFDDFEDAAARFADAERDPSVVAVPAGGSSAVGTLGWVGAGKELAAQIARGETPRPDRVVMPLGTAGTVVGALLGLARAGVEVPIVAVRVVPAEWLPPERVHALLDEVAPLAGVAVDRALRDRLVIDDDWIGAGYGHATDAATAAVERAAGADDAAMALETTYSGKAFAAALAHHARGGRTLFWQTHHQGPLPAPLVPAVERSAFGWHDVESGP